MTRPSSTDAQPPLYEVPRWAPRPQSLGTRVRASPWSRSVTLLIVFAALIGLGLLHLRTPTAHPASAPPSEFSAERAVQHLRAIAAESRAIGMPGHEAARAYLVDQLRALGLEPEVHTATGIVRFPGADFFGTGTVMNVVARMPGTASTGAVALNAHYDSGPTGPGASDAGSGVVAVLETLRALRAGPALRNDVIVVFSDGEEKRDIGAAAFNDEHPWARDVRLALHYEAVGTGGPALLYVISKDNGWLTHEFFRVVPNPSAYSLWPEVDRLLPMLRAATDLEEYRERGSAGLGFIYHADTPAYHTILDNVDRIDAGSVQQEGGYTLALVRHFGQLDLSNLPRASDRVFFNVLPGVVVHYRGEWVVPLAIAATALVGLLLVAGVRRRRLTLGVLPVGLLVFLLGTLGSVVGATLAWIVIQSLNPEEQVYLVGSYQTVPYVVGLVLLAIALLTGLYALVRRRVRLHNLVGGALLGWLLLLWLTSLSAPGMSYIVLWPLLFTLLPLAWDVLAGPERRPWTRMALLAAGAIPVLLLPATLHVVVTILSYIGGIAELPLLGISALLVAPLVGLLLLQIDVLDGESTAGRRWLVPGVTGLLAVALIGWTSITSGFDAEHPRPNRIAYELNANTGQARWLSPDRHLDDWTRQFFPAEPEQATYERDVGTIVQAYAAPAPTVALAPPQVALLSDSVDGGVRTVRLHLSSPRGASDLDAWIAATGAITAAELDGRPLALDDYAPAAGGQLTFAYAGVPAAGVDLRLVIRSLEPIGVTVRDTSHGLPQIPDTTIQPRPPEFMPALGFALDPTLVQRSFAF